MTVKIKICGTTNVEDALVAVDCGADYLGLIFHPSSPRCVSIERAVEIASAVPANVQKVGLFVDAAQAVIKAHCEAIDLDLLQFHGNESEADILQASTLPYLKAIRMKPDLDLEAEMAKYPAAWGFLLDAYHPSIPGGTGDSFDWERFPKAIDKPLFLAGGLNSENVAEAIEQTHPYAVDVVTGVEKSKGIKDHARLDQFCAAVKGCE